MLAKFTLAQTVADLSELYERSFSMPRDGYRPWATVLRLVLGVPFCSVVVLRYIWFDSWLLRHWDQGWRPWRLNALRILPIRIWLYRLYAFIGRHPTNFGIRRRLGPLIAAAKAPFSIPARMRLYQFYSFVGRQPTGFGIRKRVSRLIAKAKAPFSNSTPNAALPVLLVHRQTSDQFWYTEAPKDVVFEGFLFIAARKADTPAIAAELKSLTSSPYQYRGRSAAQFEAMLKGRGTPCLTRRTCRRRNRRERRLPPGGGASKE